MRLCGRRDPAISGAPFNQLYVASKDERGARRDDENEVDRRELLIGYEPATVLRLG